jgi:hypothetical protein
MTKVKDIIGKCNTGLAKGLSDQCIKKLNALTKTPLLVKVDHPLLVAASSAVNFYLQPKAAQKLIDAANQRKVPMTINSCLRTTVQQAIIRIQYEQGLCGISAAASPGRSNHERGLAIDIQNPNIWEEALEDNGWARLGQWDPPHYDYNDGRSDIARLQIQSFQMLWNTYNPTKLLAIDGVYGPKTQEAILNSPIAGWKA